MLWDEGHWEPLSDPARGLKDGSLKFIIYGQRLVGKWALIRKNTSGKAQEQWLLVKEKDGLSKEEAGIEQFNTGIRSGRTMEDIKNPTEKKARTDIKNPFEYAEPQLAKSADTLPSIGEWVYELKYDGYRIIAYAEGGGVRLLTRNGNDYTGHFSDIAASVAALADGDALVLDGEVVAADENGRSDFNTLQNRIKQGSGKGLIYVVFDLLAWDGKDLRQYPLEERKEKLRKILRDASKNLSYSAYTADIKEENLRAVCEGKFEGLIAKRAGSPYNGGRNGDWIKLKCRARQEFVIGGYILSDKKKDGLGSVLLGYYEDGLLIYAGRAGTGFSESQGAKLIEVFNKLRTDKPSFEKVIKAVGAVWLKPELAAEIEFTEWTEDGLLRHPSFLGLREDKAASDVYRDEQPVAEISGGDTEAKGKNELTVAGVKLTNPDKILFSDTDITKRRVAEYYNRIAARMLPYTEKRILSLVRCPKGVSGQCFFKKHPDGGGVITIGVTNDEGKQNEYFYIEGVFGLISEVQRNTLEFHVWGSRIENINNPDIMVFDLDPDEGMELERIRQGVRDLKSLLDGLSLISYLKTSGGKGYHIVVPFNHAGKKSVTDGKYHSDSKKSGSGWETFSGFARRLAEYMEQKWPERYTSNVRKEKRKGRIFIDWMRNGRGATSIAPYSIRARRDAKVSMPIEWSELDKIAPDGITMVEAEKRLKREDPWADFFGVQKEQRLM